MFGRYAVYMIASGHHGTLYIGVTSDLKRRVWQHRNKEFGGFTAKYDVNRLVWYEQHETPDAAIAREKRLKKYRRSWKINLIEENNPDWNDLYFSLFDMTPNEMREWDELFPE
jgi:putative endonuclease